MLSRDLSHPSIVQTYKSVVRPMAVRFPAHKGKQMYQAGNNASVLRALPHPKLCTLLACCDLWQRRCCMSVMGSTVLACRPGECQCQ